MLFLLEKCQELKMSQLQMDLVHQKQCLIFIVKELLQLINGLAYKFLAKNQLQVEIHKLKLETLI